MKTADQRTTADGVLHIRPEIRALEAYRLPSVPAAQGPAVIRLHQNEAPEDWPEDIKREIAGRLVTTAWHRYPSARADEACGAIGAMQGTPPSMIAATAGSNEALWATFAACASGGTVVMPSPTYSMARTLAVAAGAKVVDVPLADGFALDPAAVLRAAHACRAELVYLASPNNPTGNALDRDAVLAVVAGAPGAVMVDEAYWEFASASFLDVLDRFGHLILVRTFSKAMGGAGLRVGWLTAQPSVIGELVKVIPPYSLNVLAQAAVPVLVARRDLAASRVRTIVAERERVAGALRAFGMTVHASETNFLLFEPGRPPADVWQALAERGVLVRNVSGSPRLRACLRVSIGTPADNDRLIAALAAGTGRGAL